MTKAQNPSANGEFFCTSRKQGVGSGHHVSQGVLPVSNPGSVTALISALKTGDDRAAQELWERYFRRLLGLARSKLRKTSKAIEDEEDVAQKAFYSFCCGAEQGRFLQLKDRNNLWPLLVKITERKVIDLIKHQQALRAGGGKVQVLGLNIEEILGREPSPAIAAEMSEAVERLLEQLGEEKLREIAVMKMEGYTDKEVAGQMNIALRTMERKLKLIRCIWKKEIAR